MSEKVIRRAPKKKGAYKLPDPISVGEILTDVAKKQWILGKSIGIGGFGEIYSGIYSYLTLIYYYSYAFYNKYILYTPPPIFYNLSCINRKHIQKG